MEHQLETPLKAVQEYLTFLDTPPCTVAEGWKMPEPPDSTRQWEPVAELDEGEWNFYWEHDDTDVTNDYRPMNCPWPFNEGNAYPDDFERLGFSVRTY